MEEFVCYPSPSDSDREDGSGFREWVRRTGHSHWNIVELGFDDLEEIDSLIPLCKQCNLKIDTLSIDWWRRYDSDYGFSESLVELCITVCPSELELNLWSATGRGIVNFCRGLISAPTIALLISAPTIAGVGAEAEEACQAFVECFRSLSSTLHRFSCSGLNMEHCQIVHIAETLEMPHTSLRSLELTGVSTEGVRRLATAIQCCQLQDNITRLQELTLTSPQIADKELRYLARALQNPNSSLQYLSLSHCNIGDEGVKCLAETINTSNATLKLLDLSSNEITDEGAVHIASILESLNGSLEELHITFNFRMSEVGGAMVLRSALQQPHNTLKRLELSEIGDEGAECLLSSPHCHLVTLGLIPTTIKVLITIADFLQLQGCKLQELSLYRYQIFGMEDLDVGRRKLLLALDSCYWCPLTQISDFMEGAEAFGKTSSSLVKRNAAIRKGDLLQFESVQPSTGKLFVCGNAPDAK